MRFRLWIFLGASSGLGKMRKFVELSPADEISFLAGNLKIVSFAHNNGNAAENNPNSFKTQFNPAVAIVIVVFLSILFFMGVFSIYIRRCIMDDDRTGPSARVGPVNNDNAEAPRGLERSVIESFPVFSYSLVKGLKSDEAKGSECAVCLSDFQGQEMLRLLPKCSHAFHPECIDMWLCSNTTCPLCRTSLLPDPARASTEVAFVEASTQTPPEQSTVATDCNGGQSNDEGAPPTSHDSAGHCLVRVRKELEQPTEWYIATSEGLTPGLRKSCSFQFAQGPSCSKGTPLSGSLGNAACRARSERWGSISVNPASFLRTFSERFVPQPAESKRFNGRTGALG